MDRLACVDIPKLPIQLLLDRYPQWKGLPAVVVAQERPQGEILWVSPEAEELGITPGMRYAQALNLVPNLRAAHIPDEDINSELDQITRLLLLFSPEVEMSDVLGVFWLGVRGLSRLFPSPRIWAQKLQKAIFSRGRRASVVVGFSRFRTYAIARVTEGIKVLDTPREEQREFSLVPIRAIYAAPDFIDLMEKLGVKTIGEFVRLPLPCVEQRFGEEVARFHQLASGEFHDPLQPQVPEEPVESVVYLDPPMADSSSLLFTVKRHLHPLLSRMAKQGRAVAELEIRWSMGKGEERTDRIKPARPTLDEALLVDLVRLKLEATPLPHPVEEMGLKPLGVRGEPQQLRLFVENPKRDLLAGERALARLRTELGEEAVVRARIVEGHLPEARFLWESMIHLPVASPTPTKSNPTLVRRVYTKPQCLGIRPRHEPDGWIVRDLQCGPVTRIWGPYVISGGWWRREIHRSYYFLETLRGDILWVYYDEVRKRWFLQGQVE